MKTLIAGALAIAVALAMAIPIAVADDAAKLVGTWKLNSFDVEYQSSGEKRPVYSSDPHGYVVFTPEGRLLALITGGGRKPATTNDERAALLTTMLGYSGMYRLEPDRFIIKVDVSWNEQWTGTEQVRFFKLQGDHLDVVSAWAPSGNLPEKPIVRGILSFERGK